jgi:hypothetical protein
VRDALAAGTSATRRALLHREAGRLLAARPGADAAAIAHHARLGRDPELAARALTDAGRVASARYDQVEAAGLLDEAIALHDSADARLVRGRVRLLLTNHAGALEDALVAEHLGGGAPALELAAWASHYLREFAAAAAYADAGAATASDPLVRSGCLAIGGWTRMSIGSLRDAEPVLVAAMEVAGVRPHAMAPVGLGGLRLFQGRLDESLHVFGGLTEWPDDPQPALTQAYVHMLRGMALGHAGRPVDALAEFTAMESNVATRNLERFVARADNFIAWVLRNMGQTIEARERTRGHSSSRRPATWASRGAMRWPTSQPTKCSPVTPTPPSPFWTNTTCGPSPTTRCRGATSPGRVCCGAACPCSAMTLTKPRQPAPR